MFPPETSLIPVTVALARFVETNGLSSMLGWYPHWYLGVSFRYLTGPIIPLIQISLHRVIPTFSLFEITYAFLFLSFLASVVGWGVFVYKVQNSKFKIQSYIIVLLLLLLPWRYLSTLALSEASGTIAKNLLPFVLLVFWQYYKKRNRKNAIYAILSLSVLLLINTSVFSIIVVGLASIVLASSFKKGKFRGLTKKIKSSLFVILASLFVATLWYTPGYWVTVVGNPSIGGASGIKAFLRVFDLLRASLPLILAIVAVYFSGRIKSKLTIFSLVWVLTFLFLTLFRFIGDPDFWQDWTSWLSELEIGVALLASSVILDLRLKILDKKIPRSYYIVLASLILPFALSYYVHGLLQKPKLISNSIPTGVASLEKLNEIAGDKRAFISGSTVFWANALYDLDQVRGGVDKAATHPYWDHAAFQLREGNSPELAGAWLEATGTSYALIHGPSSAETYHDFRNLRKWEKVGDVVWDGNGDIIVRIPESSKSWTVNIEELDKVQSPDGGEDETSLSNYISAKRNPVKVERSSPNIITLTVSYLEEGEGIVVAESYDRKWKASDGSRIDKDPLGNLLVLPKDYSSSTVSLEYK